MMKQKNIIVAGSNGYVGAQLTQLIKKHSHFHLLGVLKREPSVESNEFVLGDIASGKTECDALMLATPEDVSIDMLHALKDIDIKVIDLSSAFRIHQDSGLTDAACYGLMPWANQAVSHAKLIANPGCYVTAALMSLIPLIKSHVIAPNNIVIDAKSGVSGAGIKPNQQLMFGEMSQNFFPYKIGYHQHTPEIEGALKFFAHKDCHFTFVTHILPVERGISMSIYADVADTSLSDKANAALITQAFQEAYQDYPLLEFIELNTDDAQKDKTFVSLKTVVHTPKTQIGFLVKNKKVYLCVSLDNLMKGAASQAIENLNVLYQLPPETGLL